LILCARHHGDDPLSVIHGSAHAGAPQRCAIGCTLPASDVMPPNLYEHPDGGKANEQFGDAG
jgi:hypothetical protein